MYSLVFASPIASALILLFCIYKVNEFEYI